jgi:RNA polymerase sigma-70 factor (family 1)
MSDLSEKNDLIKVSKGDEIAYNRLYYRYHQQLGTHIFRITNSMDLAEEIVQDVFLKIWMNREALSGVHNFKAYLFVISKNHTLNCLRKLSRERNHLNICEEKYMMSLTSDNGDLNSYHNILDEAIDRLPPQQQRVYLLSRHERLRYAEVADKMNISHESVKKYLRIANASIIAFVKTNLYSVSFLSISSTFF